MRLKRGFTEQCIGRKVYPDRCTSLHLKKLDLHESGPQTCHFRSLMSSCFDSVIRVNTHNVVVELLSPWFLPRSADLVACFIFSSCLIPSSLMLCPLVCLLITCVIFQNLVTTTTTITTISIIITTHFFLFNYCYLFYVLLLSSFTPTIIDI